MLKNPQMIAIFVLLLVVGCTLFDTPGYYDEDGIFHEPTKGTMTKVAEGAKSVSGAIPFGVLISGALTVIAGAGAAVQTYRKKKDIKEAVGMLAKLKAEIATITTDKDLEDFLNRPSVIGNGFGRALKKTHTALKKQLT